MNRNQGYREQKTLSAVFENNKDYDMKYFLSAAAASGLMAGAAFAGNIEPAPQEPVIAPAPAPAYTSPNWTGFYAGGQLGYADASGSGTGTEANDFPVPTLLSDGAFNPATLGFSANGNGMIGGITLGYDHDFGNWVAGVGADYDWTDIKLGNGVTDMGEGPDDIRYGTKLESIWRLKARAGYKIGDGLLYATAGYAQADTKDWGNEDGYFVGAGYEHLITENISLGAEVLYHEFNNFTRSAPAGYEGYGGVSDYDLDVTTAQVRATFRF